MLSFEVIVIANNIMNAGCHQSLLISQYLLLPDKAATMLPDNSFVNISYNFMTPVDADNTRYFWFQHRNGDPDNEALQPDV